MPDGDPTHIPTQQVDPVDLVYDISNILSKLSNITSKLYELQTSPKSEKHPESTHNKQE